ncbi:hypothetical protein [Comamonas sp.]|uniref:hypothetical protein n=1 Tax=Comamonas sp. TaxID=34028 RepID=UPI0012CA55E0|nr:hypothetical protein [Comamonas sp.]MPS96190.1 hypothetical protein [Comamonas sp.]
MDNASAYLAMMKEALLKEAHKVPAEQENPKAMPRQLAGGCLLYQFSVVSARESLARAAAHQKRNP